MAWIREIPWIGISVQLISDFSSTLLLGERLKDVTLILTKLDLRNVSRNE